MEGATDLQYLEVPCQRQVADSVGSPSQFSQGVQVLMDHRQRNGVLSASLIF